MHVKIADPALGVVEGLKSQIITIWTSRPLQNLEVKKRQQV